MTPPSGPDRVAVELAELRGEIRTGFAELNGRLDLALQRTTTAEGDITALQDRVASLERKQWPLPTIGVLAGVAGAATGALALLR
ncbi:hypothetical protein [Streptomyces sp. sk2.1]|uniref:hypothetical protein n=1 Tax=Streptomyces sp. sk2.1 TaxID=2478959 RepID=UPI0011E87B52|nr:hypothetical protein [Streptomyces sp. sk2.1]TXS78706.1 hypothetical protein EAO76_10120 [Streptomyces sp. sk2.1]